MKSEIKKIVKAALKKNKKVEALAKDINRSINLETSIGEIMPIQPRHSISKNDSLRLNLVVPSINQEHLFGGISTAISIFEEVADEFMMERRIITTDARPTNKDMKFFSKYELVEMVEESDKNYQLTPVNDRYNKTLAVTQNDVFFSTAWWTDYNVDRILSWQETEYILPVKPSFYLIQDYEPGFYEWSSRYLLAESTYKPKHKKIAIFNSKLLFDFFNSNGYVFENSYFFEPTINKNLYNVLSARNDTQTVKKKKILVYGRPNVKRNCFEIVTESLKKWVWLQPDISEWEVISIGEKHNEVDLGNGKKMVSLGKLTLEEYANLMLESYLGISLMASPHPSYPPLEMATFGMSVITNSYKNKDLSVWNDHIISLQRLDIDELVEAIRVECQKYECNKKNEFGIDSVNPDYINWDERKMMVKMMNGKYNG